jgi:DNA-binding NarL/FixJ family response regulator
MNTINLLLADDHLVVRDAIKMMLQKNSKFNIIALAKNGKEVISYLDANPSTIDVVVMDINMPVMSGIEATEIITKKHSSVNVLALTMHEESTYISKMIDAGAVGYVLKGSKALELESAIKSVVYGTKYYSNSVSLTMINSLLNKNKPENTALSDREKEILVQVTKGRTNQEVGENLNISKRTVETHRRNILAKLNMKNTAEMIRYAIQNKLVS